MIVNDDTLSLLKSTYVYVRESLLTKLVELECHAVFGKICVYIFISISELTHGRPVILLNQYSLNISGTPI